MKRLPALPRFWTTVRRLRGDPATSSTASPPAIPDAERAAALAELDAIRDRCRAMVRRRAALSAGAAVVPLPGVDIGTDVAILVDLLPRINERFGLSPAQIERLDADTKRIVMVLVSAVGSSVVGRVVTRELVTKLLLKMGLRATTKGVVKYVPLVGQAVSATLSFGAMKMLGDRHIDDCHAVARQALRDATAPRR